MIQIAQIGVGYWGPNLLRNLVASDRCEVALVVDASKERRAFVADLYPNILTSGEFSDALDNPKIDAVVIATPANTHFDLAMKALEAGKHVLVEKPMASSVEEVDAISALASSKNRVAMVGHTFLFYPAVRVLKALIDSGELGEVRYIYSQRLNLGRIRPDVDALWNLAPHDISIIQYLLDDPEPETIRRTGMDFIQPGIDDVVFLNITYPGKVLAHVHVSWLDPHKVRCLTVVGSKKMAVYDDMAKKKIAISDKGIEPKAVLGERMDYDASATPTFIHRSGEVSHPTIPDEEPLRNEIDHFLTCIATGAPCLTGPAHARKVVEILAGGKGGGNLKGED